MIRGSISERHWAHLLDLRTILSCLCPSNACQFQSCEAHALPSAEILGLQACKEAHAVTEAERDLTDGSTDVKNEDNVSKTSVEVSDEPPGQDAPQYFAMLHSAAHCSASACS